MANAGCAIEPRRSMGAWLTNTSSPVSSSSRTSRARISASMSGPISRRTALLELRRRPGSSRLDSGGELVVGLLFLEGQVGVAADPERVVGHDHHAGEEVGEVLGDDLLEWHVALAVREDDEAGEQVGHLHPGEAPDPRVGIADEHAEVEREVRDVGERMAGIDGQRRQHRVHVALEDVDQMGPVVVTEGRPVDQLHAGLGQAGCDLHQEHAVEVPEELQDPLADRHELLDRGHAVGRHGPQACGHLVLQGSHPHLEELIQVLREDRGGTSPARAAGCPGCRPSTGPAC